MDGRKWYWCDPSKNTACRKRGCCDFGGPCELTSRAECAVRDHTGKPVEADPRQLLREKMERKRRENGGRRENVLFEPAGKGTGGPGDR